MQIHTNYDDTLISRILISTGSVGRNIASIKSDHGGLCTKLQPGHGFFCCWNWGLLLLYLEIYAILFFLFTPTVGNMSTFGKTC